MSSIGRKEQLIPSGGSSFGEKRRRRKEYEKHTGDIYIYISLLSEEKILNMDLNCNNLTVTAANCEQGPGGPYLGDIHRQTLEFDRVSSAQKVDDQCRGTM